MPRKKVQNATQIVTANSHTTLSGQTTTYTANPVNQYSAISGQPQTADANGNITRLLTTSPQPRQLEFTRDDQSRLIRAGNLLTGHASEYAYNSSGQRIEERRYATLTDAQLVETIRILYLGWQPIAHYRALTPGGGTRPANTTIINQASSLPPSAFTLHTSQTWGPDLSSSLTATGGVGALLATTQPASAAPGGSAPSTLYPSYDSLGNVHSLIDSQGQLRALYRYSAYGLLTESTVTISAIGITSFVRISVLG